MENISLCKEIELLSTLLNDTVSRVEVGEPGELFKQLQSLRLNYEDGMKELRYAIETENWHAVSSVYDNIENINVKLDTILAVGIDLDDKLHTIIKLAEQKRKLVETERFDRTEVS